MNGKHTIALIAEPGGTRRKRSNLLTDNLLTNNLPYIPTYIHTYLHTYLPTYIYIHTYLPTILPSRSFTISFVFPSFPVPAKTIEVHFRKKLTCGVIRSFNCCFFLQQFELLSSSKKMGWMPLPFSRLAIQNPWPLSRHVWPLSRHGWPFSRHALPFYGTCHLFAVFFPLSPTSLMLQDNSCSCGTAPLNLPDRMALITRMYYRYCVKPWAKPLAPWS